jgi:lysophospholipase L1-like esterase
MKRLAFSALCLAVIAVLYNSSALAQSQQRPVANCSELPVVKERLKRVETYLKDWPNLDRYREENSRLAPPAKGETRVVFLGDSITDSWDNPEYGGFFPGKPYINRGISGQRTQQMLIRFRPDVIALQPKVVVILAGTNDIADLGSMRLSVVKDNLSSMAELARVHAIRVVLASLLPVNDYKQTRDGKQLIQTTNRPPELIRMINDWIKDYAERNGHIYLDYYTAVVDDKEMLREDLTDDGVHPNARGYTVMAPLAERVIERALKKR